MKILDQKFDVVVVGGGLAGVASAISAAREGMKVLLIEQYGFLGGMATMGLVNPFMKYSEHGTTERVLANSGIFFNIIERMTELGAMDKNQSCYAEEYMKLVLDRMIKENSISILFHTMLTSVKMADRKVTEITVSCRSGNFKIQAPVFIDGTGDADLSAFAGISFKRGREADNECQPMTLCFRMCNVDWSRYDHKAANELYKSYRAQGIIKNPREDILVFRVPIENVMHFNTTRIVMKDPTNTEDLTWSEMEAREQVFEMVNFLKKNVAGFEKADLIMSAPQIGVRESRRICGHTIIRQEDIDSGTKFDDRIARGTYHVDIHNPTGSGTILGKLLQRDFYTIPYSAMVPLDADNVIVAGRPLSSTHEAHSAFRIMPITTCIGEAAGVAASLMLKYGKNAIDIPVKEMQDILVNKGALI